MKLRHIGKVVKIGGNLLVVLPRKMTREMGIEKGQYIELNMIENPETKEKVIVLKSI